MSDISEKLSAMASALQFYADGGDWYYKHSESEGDRVDGKITHWLPLHTTPKVKT